VSSPPENASATRVITGDFALVGLIFYVFIIEIK